MRTLAEARWPETADDAPPRPIAGFINSSFSPLVAEVAERCLSRYSAERYSGELPLPDNRIAVVIATASGDLATTLGLAEAVDAGTRVAPLLFFQAVPNAVAGHIAARWNLGGPVVCLADAADALPAARLLLRDGDAEAALVVLAEQADGDPTQDRASAVLVTEMS